MQNKHPELALSVTPTAASEIKITQTILRKQPLFLLYFILAKSLILPF